MVVKIRTMDQTAPIRARASITVLIIVTMKLENVLVKLVGQETLVTSTLMNVLPMSTTVIHHLKTVQTLVVDLCVFVCMETAAQVVLVSVAYEEKLSLSLYFFFDKKI